MPIFTMVSPKGQTFEVKAPEGATQEQVITYAKANWERIEKELVQTKSPHKVELELVLEALKRADAAGNTEDAQHLAKIAQNLMQPPVQSTLSQMPVVEPPPPQTTSQPDAALMAIFFTVVAVLLVGSILWARRLNTKHLIRYPECKPFAWGFYQATQFIIVPPFLLMAMRNGGANMVTQMLVLAIFLLVFLPPMVMTLRRSRIGFILMTTLSLNPLLWVINGIYLKNRWNEMAGANPPPVIHNDHFGNALSELDNGNRDNGLWARCFAEAGGNDSAARAAYIKLRAAQLATRN